jgi:regulator of protease activity HflC (stomatin/prohibitin superfamily)
MNSKAALVERLKQLADALGEPATPLVWRLAGAKELEELVADAEARLKARANANARSSDDIIAAARRRNDNEWFDAGGTRN